jgi:hypothetical protein
MAWTGLALLAGLMLGVKRHDRRRCKKLTAAERAEEDDHLKNEINTW